MKGYISEVFSSFQGEGGSVQGSCQGKRQIFIRFAGCNLAEQAKPCVWCDSPKAQRQDPPQARVEKKPGSMTFDTLTNPLDIDKVLELVEGLRSPDLHSLSITGGEPLCQPDFLEALCTGARQRIYLETNGTLPEAARSIAPHIDLACVDLKDESAIPYPGWKEVVEMELDTIRHFKAAGVIAFAKVVVTDKTKPENLSWYAKKLSEIGTPLAIQPATLQGVVRVSIEKLFRLTEAASKYLSAEDLTVSLQTHKTLGLL